jgi:hypothetical protein
MDSNISASDVDERLTQPAYRLKAGQKARQKIETAVSTFSHTEFDRTDLNHTNLSHSELSHPESHVELSHAALLSETALSSSLAPYPEVLDQVGQLEVTAQVALIHRLMSQLESNQIQAILEFGQQELTDRRQGATAHAEVRQTRLLLKKDYSYQNQGLGEPTQYYVYLRRRSPKLDRYIGTLFYVPQGCALSYSPNADGQIRFNSPGNIFQLQDTQHPEATQIVRLLSLEPPPPDYTFTKQQNDAPDIHLRLEYLDSTTYQPIAEELYLFPTCMYEGGKLDRYRWKVSRLTLPTETNKPDFQVNLPANLHVASKFAQATAKSRSQAALLDKASGKRASSPAAAKSSDQTPVARSKGTVSPSNSSTRRILELPPTATSTFYLSNRCDAAAILERMRLWVAWSEKAMPQSRWEVVQNGMIYTLSNASFKRSILNFSLDRASITLNNSLPVLVKWFHDLGLAVSQGQMKCSPAQLKLAQQLFVEMSLPQDNPLIALEKLFGIKFSKTSLYK